MATETMPTITQEALTECRFRLYQQFPFWAVMLERFRILATDQIPTAGVTDEGNIYFNPAFWYLQTVGQRTFILAHEIAHKAFDHFRRICGRDPMVWNIAGDYAINLLVHGDMGNASTPAHILMDKDFENLTAESIYDLVIDKAKKIKCQGFAGSDLLPDEIPGATVVQDPREQQPQTDREWRTVISSSLVAARMRGKMPAGLERAILKRLEAQVDWATRLGHLLKQSLINAGNKEQTWLPPARRFVYQGWYFPRINIGRCPRMVWAVDTSGSRSQEHLVRAHSEIDAARKLFDVEVYVMDCDAKVYAGKWIKPLERLPMPKGGGGTDFRPVFDHIAKEELKPDVLVFFTDTWGLFPVTQPLYPVLWVVDRLNAQVPWGEMIPVKV